MTAFRNWLATALYKIAEKVDAGGGVRPKK